MLALLPHSLALRRAPFFKNDTPVIEELFGDLARVDKPHVYVSGVTGKSAAVVSVRYPTPSDEPDETGKLIASGLLFQRWIQAVYTQSFYPLWQVSLAGWMIAELCR